MVLTINLIIAITDTFQEVKHMRVIRIISFSVVILINGLSLSQEVTPTGKEYSDSHHGKVFFPLGDLSFADKVVSFVKGKPAHPKADPINALRSPKERKTAVLGCGGVLTLRFVDNALIDVQGPDIYVFEVGPDIEQTYLSISKDGNNWIEIGMISGGRADIDISQFVKPNDVFHYIRLKDAFVPGCGGSHPGADINAVGAIGSALQFSMKSSVLFDFGKWVLKSEAKKELQKLANVIKKYPGAGIVIEGHTDRIGPEIFNQKLSENRGKAVRNYLLKAEKLDSYEIKIHGYGESRPIASNETEAGREKNRRVGIILIPKQQEETEEKS